MDTHLPPVRIGFYDPFNVYERLRAPLSTNIHLTNIHWRKSPNDPLRSIASLPVNLIEETPKCFDNSITGPEFTLRDLPTEQQQNKVVDMLSIPHIRLMFLQCQDTDSYRATVRPLIKEWLKSNVSAAHGPVEWYLILYTEESKTQARIFDKLKTDFDADTSSERCIHVKQQYDVPTEEHEIWASINLALKQSLLTSFSRRLDIMRSGVMALFSDIKTNFSLYITLREGIASQLLSIHLFDDSLVEFDALNSVIVAHQLDPDLFPPQKWNEQDPHLMEKYMTQPAFFTRELSSFNLYQVKSFIFSKIFTIFEALSDTASSLSLSSLHVAEFLKRLQRFIHDISSDFSGSSDDAVKLDEWAYMIINDVMSLDICAKMSVVEPDENGESSQISEKFGELLLLQRSKLLDIAQSFDYFINGVLTDIRLSSVSKGLKITYEPLKTVLATEKAFQDHFVLLTETAINHFGISDRPRTVDALSIDIALLDYGNKQYEKAAIVLSTCPEFYGSQGWNTIGFSLLQTYIDCLEHLDEKCEFFVSGDQPVSKDDLLAQCYVAVLSSLKTNENAHPSLLIKSAVDHLSTAVFSKGTQRQLEVEDFLSLSVSVFVSSSGSDIYDIFLGLESMIPLVTTLKDLKLILENTKGETIEFCADASEVAPGKSTIKLSTTSIQFGTFTLTTFAAKFGPLSLIHVFEGKGKKEVEVFPMADNLKLRIGSSTDMDLNVKPVSVFIDLAHDIKDVVLKVWRGQESFSILEDVVVKTQDANKLQCSSVSEDSIAITSLSKNNRYEVIIPFVTPENPKDKILDLYASLAYELDGSLRQQTVFKNIDPALTIAVSVQDIFKSDGLYSRFTIGAGDPEAPVRIVSADLISSENFEVLSPLKAGPLIAFGDQPGNYFFKIVEKEDGKPSKDEHLELNIIYRELNEEILEVWRRQLWKDLKEKSLEKYAEMAYHSSSALQFDLNEYVLNNSLKVMNPAAFLKTSFRSIPLSDRQDVMTLFTKLVHGGVSFNPSEVNWVDKKLSISVFIPTVEVIHTLELKTDTFLSHVALGEEISASLDITCFVTSGSNCKSENPAVRKRVLFEGEQSPLNKYSVEILPNQDSWLINGKTKFVLQIDKSEKKLYTFPSTPLTLIPLRVGKLALPKIKIKNLNMNSKNEYLMEVDYKNESETISVVSGAV